MDYEYFVGTGKEVADLLGLSTNEVAALSLDKEHVPEALWELIPFAEAFGISDDILRHRIFEKAPEALLKKLKLLIDNHDDELDEWLAGPEADAEVPTEEYVAFSAMRMSVDFLNLTDEKSNKS